MAFCWAPREARRTPKLFWQTTAVDSPALLVQYRSLALDGERDRDAGRIKCESLRS